MRWDKCLKVIAILAYNAFLFGVVAYAVFEMGHSGWWFAIAIVFAASSSSTDL